MTPSKLLIAAYMIGGCIAGSMLETGKKPLSAQVTYGLWAYLALLVVAAILMARRAIKQSSEPDKPNWWALYGNLMTAGVCFGAGLLLITVGLF